MKKTYKISGMHCNSCAQLIESALKEKVNKVSVNYSTEKAEIDFNPEKIPENEIKDKVKELGYNINEINEKKASVDKPALIFMISAIVIAIVFLYFIFLRNIQLPDFKIPSFGEKTSLILLFVAGLLTGFHCVSMCGGFVVSYTAKNALNGHKSFKQHFVYGGSKVISYAIVGGIFGLIGGIFAFSTKLRGTVAILAGVFMIFYALSMFGIKFFRRFQLNPKFISKLSKKDIKGHYKLPFFTGLLNGLFLACGPLQAMYLYAAGTGNFFTGAVSLAVFGLGTLPVMLGFGSLTTVISHKTTQKILRVSAIIVLILGLIMLNRGLTLTGSPVTFDSLKTKSIITGINSSNIIINNGTQEISMTVDASGYHPNSFVLKKGIPVKWNINVIQLTGCNSELVANQYNIDIKLKQGINVINFTPDKTGTIPFSCGMGMLHGSFIVTDTGIASQQQIATATPSSGSTCSMGASCGCGG